MLAFKAPPHRCEKVAVIDGAIYLNDSKSTNLHSLESALNGQEEPVVLIAGGKNKGLDFSELREVAARSVREAVCIGEIAGHIASAWDGAVPCRLAAGVDDAVEMARTLARPEKSSSFPRHLQLRHVQRLRGPRGVLPQGRARARRRMKPIHLFLTTPPTNDTMSKQKKKPQDRERCPPGIPGPGPCPDETLGEPHRGAGLVSRHPRRKADPDFRGGDPPARDRRGRDFSRSRWSTRPRPRAR